MLPWCLWLRVCQARSTVVAYDVVVMVIIMAVVTTTTTATKPRVSDGVRWR